MTRRAALLRVVTLVCALVAAGEPPEARTDETVYSVYAQNPAGKLSVNGTVLDRLPGDFQATDWGVYYPDEGWSALALDGQRRYSLRRDGIVRSDGSKLHELPFEKELGSYWFAMAVSGGTTWCLRQDGLVCVGGDVLAKLPTDVFAFSQIVARGGHVWTLRTDGAIFQDDDDHPVYRLVGGPGAASLLPDGMAYDSEWIAMALHPSEDYAYAMRVDGVIRRADLADPGSFASEGEGVAALPFYLDTDADGDHRYDQFPLLDDAYVDLEFKDNGVWVALAGDGRVYISKSSTTALVDFPGEALDLDDAYTDLATADGAFWAVRTDGYVYRGDEDVPRLTLPAGGYGRIAVSSAPPNLGDADEHPPKCVVYTTRTLAGRPLDVPVMATDVETPSADLVVTPTSLPSDSSGSSATWDAANRVLRWHAPQVPGKYRFEFKVEDGHAVSRFVFKLNVLAPDADPLVENEPTRPAIDGARPIIGRPFSFTVIADDVDGDAVAVSADAKEYPFDAGATFDPVTRRFEWTPAATDQGNRTAKFRISDGTKERTLKVKLSVRQGLGF